MAGGTSAGRGRDMAALTINGKAYQADVDPRTPLLWVIRDTLGLTGTKYGCGIAQCGCCTVHISGVATRSCSVPVSYAQGKQITTIEGLAVDGKLSKVQQAWLDHEVPQCGYCQSGMIMAVAALLKDKSAADGRRHRRRDHQHLPLRHLCAGPRGDPRRGQGLRERHHELDRLNPTAAPFSSAPARSAA